MSKKSTLLLSLAVACELGLGVTSPVARAQCIANQFAKLQATDTAAGDELGRSVAIGGDVTIVGVPKDDDRGTDSGAAIVYRFDGMTWTQEAKLLAADGSPEDYFGLRVGLSGNVAIGVGPLEDCRIESVDDRCVLVSAARKRLWCYPRVVRSNL